MWFARRSEKGKRFSASLVGTNHDLKTNRILSKGQASKTTQSDCLHTKASSAQNADAGRAQNITRHMKRLSFASKLSSSFSMNLALAQMGALLIGLTRLGTMNQAMCGGRQ
jgi:hypothetical protein